MGVRVHIGKLDAFGGSGYGLLVKTGILGTGTNTTIDDDGLAVTDASSVERVRVGDISGGAGTDYGLKVTNAGSTVIIDGSSNMFKIQTTGTHSIAVSSDSSGSTVTELTGLGTFTVTPGHLSYVSNGNAANSDQHLGTFFTQVNAKWTSSTSGGATDQDVVIPDLLAEAHVHVASGDSLVDAVVAGWNRTGSSVTFYSRYYILEEASL